MIIILSNKSNESLFFIVKLDEIFSIILFINVLKWAIFAKLTNSNRDDVVYIFVLSVLLLFKYLSQNSR